MLAGVILAVPIPRAWLYFLPTLLTDFAWLTCASGSSPLSRPIRPQHSAQFLFPPCLPHVTTQLPHSSSPCSGLFISWSCQNTVNPVKSGLASLPLGPRPMPHVFRHREEAVLTCAAPRSVLRVSSPRCTCDQREPRKGQALDF